MSLKFFVDQCVPHSIIGALVAEGHTVIKLKDCVPPDSEDSRVIAKAQEFNAILLSLDNDFADIVMYPPSRYNGIIAIQLQNHPEVIHLVVERLRRYLSAHPDMEHYKGKLFVVESSRIRIRE
ncbi:MAG: DUF5615 family PIN-like protein [Candidatus Atribacteria bacterium]|nr:DUF5615 family PIN-like protein [Candidatus Atribacteria bacterium]